MKSDPFRHVQNDAQIQTRAKEEGIKTVIAQNLRDLFLDELKNIYWSEKALTKAIPKIIRQITSHELLKVVIAHLEVSKEHVTRLEDIFFSGGEKRSAVRCEAMEGLIRESEQIMRQTRMGKVRDAGIISVMVKIDHYEMATYGILCFFAKTLRQNESLALLHKSLEQEKEANEMLSKIIESMHLEMDN
jgi:ferritin-like metal-binding protein YciE